MSQPQGNVTMSGTTTTTKVSPSIRFDPSYIKTLPGFLRIAEIVISLMGFICVQTIYFAAYKSAGGWYSFVAMTAFWVCLVLTVFYLFHIVEKLHALPWLICEIIYGAIWTIFFFIAACVAAANGRSDPGWGAAAFFGFVAMGVFGFDTFLKFRKRKAGEIAQGERTTSTTNPEINNPNNPQIQTPTGPSYPTY